MSRMNVVQWLMPYYTQGNLQAGLKALNAEYGIIVKDYPEQKILVLNYDQISSPKLDLVAMECRGLILNYDLDVVSRSFDRFFNYGEAPHLTAFDVQNAIIHEKVDGSLIKLYCYKGVWHISTRGTAFAESSCNGHGTFRSLVMKALAVPHRGEYEIFWTKGCNERAFQEQCEEWLDPDLTYICEFTSVENRVVTPYTGYTLTFLAARDNATGRWDCNGDWDIRHAFNVLPAKTYTFDSTAELVAAANALPGLQEGFVVYVDGQPRCKVKSATYVAVHHIRGEGLSPKRIMQLVMTGEVDEYLTYFPEDEAIISPYVSAYADLHKYMHDSYYGTGLNEVEEQRDFAIKAKSSPWSAILFSARKNGTTPQEEWTKARESYKLDIFQQAMEAQHE